MYRVIYKDLNYVAINYRNSKVITTMVIELLDDRTYCAPSAITHLGLGQKVYNCSSYHFTTSQCILKCAALLTFSSTSNHLAEI